ncbi:Grx4 family monothiol glutaredoxin [Microcoleus sp. C2C3]|uniref:Grx4 family monothiol glutaredoxin n=1 Tax=unclassified Microcoleus TaxID=2642155 RepID=UPI002FD42DA9
MSTTAHDRIEELVKQNKIMVFMKGNKLMPQCGFSNTVVQILNQLAVPYETVDVLADQEIRQGVKEYSNWPTIPQVYIDGKFIGGSDIMIEMYQKGELQEAVEVALAS